MKAGYDAGENNDTRNTRQKCLRISYNRISQEYILNSGYIDDSKLSARFGWPSLGNGRAIVVPESVTGRVDGKTVTLNTGNNWFSYQV